MKPVEYLNYIDRDVLRLALDRVAPNRHGKECVLWTGEISTNGYGRLYLDGRKYTAHRAAWVCANGPLKPNVDACHRCDNRPCVNEDHIFPGSRAENMHDAERKGRGQSKLAAEQVLSVREMLRGGQKCAVIGRALGVSRSAISRIKRGKSWGAMP